MSNPALTWAFSLQIKPATAKFVLVAMADTVSESGLFYQAVSTLCSRTCLDRKTVLSGIQTLSNRGLIEDSGRREGRTKSVIVYRLNRPEGGTAKQSRKRDSSEDEAVPFFRRSSPVFPSKQSQKRDTEPKGTQRNPKESTRAKPKTSIPENFAMSERVRDWAQTNDHSDLDEHLEAFTLKCKAKDYKYVDWDSALMEAIRKDWAGLRNNSRSPPQAPEPKLASHKEFNPNEL